MASGRGFPSTALSSTSSNPSTPTSSASSFQETKLSRRDLAADVTTAEGYEAFFSCTRTSNKGRICYSGVATFCRVCSSYSSCEVALPMEAEEGITGLLEYYRQQKPLEREPFLEGLEDVSNSDLLKIDNEGRCIVTDHGHFVLFNLYGPRAQDNDEERLQFKSLFFLILQKRWEYLLSQGKRVIAVGDFNIAPSAVDRCDAKPDFDANRFRKWFRSMLVEHGGFFWDCFRVKHPDRKDAYTCWAQDVGAEEFNYGSRIDHIIIAGKCFHQCGDMEGHSLVDCHVEDCQIMVEFRRGKLDSRPKWKGGRSVKLEGSDHAPVYVVLRDVPDLPLHSTPCFAVRYTPEVRGLQQSIVSVLMKRQASIDAKLSGSPVMPTCLVGFNANSSKNRSTQQCTVSENYLVVSGEKNELSEHIPIKDEFLLRESSGTSIQENMSVEGRLQANCNLPAKKKLKSSSQKSILSFFHGAKSISSPDDVCSSSSIIHTQDEALDVKYDCSHETHVTSITGTLLDGLEDVPSYGKETLRSLLDEEHHDSKKNLDVEEESSNVVMKWREIQQKMHRSLPLCKGHGEPCVARSVKKAGSNYGRGFYVCARAKGPASNPEANCNYFQWASSKPKQRDTSKK